MRKAVVLLAATTAVAAMTVGLGNADTGSAGVDRGADSLTKLRQRSLSNATADRRLSKAAYNAERARLASLDGPFVASLGDFKVDINDRIALTFRFRPGRIQVPHGERVTWVEAARFKEPHTITVAKKADLPSTIDEVFSCGAPGTACEPAQGHFTRPRTLRLEDDDNGEFGLDEPGDSLFQRRDKAIRARISAPSGSRLHYICAIHPWMQGHIKVL